MTPDQIREVVKITLDELTKRKIVKDDYTYILKTVEKKLKDFFNNRGDGNNISYALNQLLDDPYIDIIFLQYRDGKTVERIAEILEVEGRTVLRNKKRLINKIYDLSER